MIEPVSDVWRRRGYSGAVKAASVLLALLGSTTARLAVGEGKALPKPAAVVCQADVARDDEALLREDLKRLIGRWERVVPGSNPPTREVMTIEDERDTFEVINNDGAVACRYTSQFKLERVGDLRIYNRENVELVKGKPLNNSGAVKQSFIFHLNPRSLHEVSGVLHGRSGSRQRHGVFAWKKIVDAERIEAGDEEAENADARQPEFEPDATAADDSDLKRDLELMQGSWLTAGRDAAGKVTWTNEKSVDGNTERLTRLDAEGNVTREHTVKFRLEKYGPIRIFTFYDMTTVIGDDVGDVVPDEFSFVYKLDGDTFLDCPGVFVSRSSYRVEPVLTVWRRPQSTSEVDAELEIEQLGGSVTRNTRDGADATSIRMDGKGFGDEQLRLLKPFQKLSELTLIDSRVTDAGMKDVARCVNLTRLDLKGTAITDVGLNEIAKLKKLKTLSLVRTRISDTGLVELAGLKELRQLYLANTNTTDDGARTLVNITELTHLGVIGTKITAAGFAELSKHGNLKTLLVGGARITEDCVEQFMKFKNLAELNVGNSRITEAGLQKIKAALPETNVHR